MPKSSKPEQLDVSTWPFQQFCTLLDDLVDATRQRVKRELKAGILIKLFARTTKFNTFPLMRLLLPQLDTDRSTYGMKEKTLADAFVAALQVAPTSETASRLINYKDPSSASRGASVGDFSVILRDVLRTRIHVISEQSKRLTITDINNYLDRLYRAATKEDKIKVLQELLFICTPNQMFWITRIILKDLKIGMKHESILQHFHQNAVVQFNTCQSLQRVCDAVFDPSTAPKTIEVGTPIKPMLCGKCPWHQILKVMKARAVIVEPKYDGERMMIHKRGSEVTLFARSGDNTTFRYNYGAAFIPLVLQAVKMNECILDGEFLTWDSDLQQFEAFGGVRTVAMEAPSIDATTGKWLCFMAFDVLWAENNSLLEMPLAMRRRVLERMITPIDHKFQVVQQQVVQSDEDILKALDAALLNRMEGIIVKNLDSHYIPNDRSYQWVKLKPDYVDGLNDNIDLLVVGGYYGEGQRRSGNISHFLLAVADKPVDAPPDYRPTKFFTFTKVGTGYSMEELATLQQRYVSKMKRFQPDRPPRFLQGWKGDRQDQPDMYIEPEDSVIFEVKSMEIVPCKESKFLAGLTLRFPRLHKIRHDKPWYECTSLEELKTRHKEQLENKRSRPAADMGALSKEKRRPTKKKERKVKEDDSFAAMITKVEQVENIFQSKEIYVINGDAEQPAGVTQAVAKRYGADVTAQQTANTFVCIAASTDGYRFKQAFKRGSANMVRPLWLMDCIEHRTVMPLSEKYLLFTTQETAQELKRQRDEFGDPYYQFASAGQLMEILRPASSAAVAQSASGVKDEVKVVSSKREAVADTAVPMALDNETVDDALASLDPEEQAMLASPYRMFHGFVAYLDMYQRLNDVSSKISDSPLELTGAAFELFGGKVSHVLDEEVTHVLFAPDTFERFPAILAEVRCMRAARRLTHDMHYVLRAWVTDCIDASVVQEYRKYMPPAARSGTDDAWMTNTQMVSASLDLYLEEEEKTATAASSAASSSSLTSYKRSANQLLESVLSESAKRPRRCSSKDDRPGK